MLKSKPHSRVAFYKSLRSSLFQNLNHQNIECCFCYTLLFRNDVQKDIQNDLAKKILNKILKYIS